MPWEFLGLPEQAWHFLRVLAIANLYEVSKRQLVHALINTGKPCFLLSLFLHFLSFTDMERHFEKLSLNTGLIESKL